MAIMGRLAILTLLALVLCSSSAAEALALDDQGTIAAGLEPERLGSPTTITLHLAVIGGRLGVPAPLTGVDVLLPGDLGIATSGLGVAACDPGWLEAAGPVACPANSRMGSGSALVEIPIGPEVREERVALSLFAGPSPDGYLHILIYAVGKSPVEAQIVLNSILLPGRLRITVPLVPSLPGAPDVSLADIRAVIGGRLTYYERDHGRTAAYHPRGISLPDRCPRSGFEFGAVFSFLDGGHAAAHTVVACPKRKGAAIS
jgi:hypothetical protein